jgi:hypothetical protein
MYNNAGVIFGHGKTTPDTLCPHTPEAVTIKVTILS